LAKLEKDLGDVSEVEARPRMEGNQMFLIFAPKKHKTAKPAAAPRPPQQQPAPPSPPQPAGAPEPEVEPAAATAQVTTEAEGV
jgi:hypothetical protein